MSAGKRLRIAFGSCCDVVRDQEQRAWEVLAAQQPDHVVLLGDNIYMDYGLGEHLGNGKPRSLPLADFSRLMHGRYARQWQVPAFHAAMAGCRVHAIWDDHDFAFNDSRGAGGDDGKTLVPAPMRRLSRALFEQFRRALREQPAQYPANPHPDGQVAVDGGGIQSTVDLLPGQLRLHLLDGRSFRQERGQGLLGGAQRLALSAAWLPAPGINIVASGTTLEDWAHYDDLAWIGAASQQHRILVLSGDIHEPGFTAPGPSRPNLYEATASALAQPPGITWLAGKRSEVFGLLDVDDQTLTVTLWRGGKPRARHVIDRASWRLQ